MRRRRWQPELGDATVQLGLELHRHREVGRHTVRRRGRAQSVQWQDAHVIDLHKERQQLPGLVAHPVED